MFYFAMFLIMLEIGMLMMYDHFETVLELSKVRKLEVVSCGRVKAGEQYVNRVENLVGFFAATTVAGIIMLQIGSIIFMLFVPSLWVALVLLWILGMIVYAIRKIRARRLPFCAHLLNAAVSVVIILKFVPFN